VKSAEQQHPLGIKIVGAKQNNLKNISLEIPLGVWTAITGPSGSGKSSLAFDTLYAEGYRRYVESLSTYARQFFERMPKPDVDLIENISPSIALQQSNPIRNSRSTVGTQTEVYDYLRLLMAKVGQTHCPSCGKVVKASTPQSAADEILARVAEKEDRAYVGFFSPEAAPADFWMGKGFVRRLQSVTQPEPQELEAERGKSLKAKSLIVFDRLSVRAGDKHRIVEALEGSFRLGKGEAFLKLMSEPKIQKFSSRFVCSHCDVDVAKPQPLLFSFNSPIGACDSCKGFGNKLDYDEKLLIPHPRLSLERGAVEPFTKPMMRPAYKKMIEFARAQKINTSTPFQELSTQEQKMILHGHGKYKGVRGSFLKLEEKKYKLHVRVFVRRYQSAFICEVCHGSRLKPAALHVKVRTKNIFDLCQMSLGDLEKWFLDIKWTAAEQTIVKEVIRQISGRLHFLNRMGLRYLNLARLAKTLSGGESQRINLANQLGAELSGTLYVLDEPSIGLHPTDRDRLVNSLKDLVTMGNTIVVVEHDLDMIAAADQVLEMGPESGLNGGQIIFQGSQQAFRESQTLTSRYMRSELAIEAPARRGKPDHWLSIQGASGNNLQNVTLSLPLHRLVGISGVSGSGKSTLIHQTLYNAMARLLNDSVEPIAPFKKLFGSEHIKGVVLLDQSSVTRSARSIPITMIGGYDEVRSLFAQAAQNQGKAFLPKHFSFNVPAGRCETCQGDGTLKTEMYFLDDLYLPCEDCDGKRFKKEVLDVRIRGKNIFDIFGMTASEARKFFAHSKSINDRLEMLETVGLGYIQLGQSSHSLSGGESQRLKIASEMMDRRKKNFLYLLDEPTTGLHVSEVKLLLRLLQKLVDSGNTVVVIEHNLDVLKSVDWLIELGPGAGADGGRVVAEGTPELIAAGTTATASFLKRALGKQAPIKEAL
jgi:excinuclease ABC subunit A